MSDKAAVYWNSDTVDVGSSPDSYVDHRGTLWVRTTHGDYVQVPRGATRFECDGRIYLFDRDTVSTSG